MIGDSAFCCFPIDIAVRLIGTISLLTNALIFIALVSDTDGILTNDKIRIIFGFDLKFFLADNQPQGGGGGGEGGGGIEWFPIFCLTFTLTAGISSALLIWASIITQRWLTVPWLVCSTFNVLCHFVSLVMLSLIRFSSVDKWVTVFTVFYSVAVLYFTLVVIEAHYMWCLQSRDMFNYSGNQEAWENVFRSPPHFQSPYKNHV